MGDVVQRANSFVSTLAQLQDSDKILASNDQAAREAIARLERARKEEIETKERIDTLRADSEREWKKAAGEIEEMKARVVVMREQAQKEYDTQVGAARNDAAAILDGIRDETRALIVERDQKKLLIIDIDAEVAAHQAALDSVKKEMLHLATRLTT